MLLLLLLTEQAAADQQQPQHQPDQPSLCSRRPHHAPDCSNARHPPPATALPERKTLRPAAAGSDLTNSRKRALYGAAAYPPHRRRCRQTATVPVGSYLVYIERESLAGQVRLGGTAGSSMARRGAVATTCGCCRTQHTHAHARAHLQARDSLEYPCAYVHMRVTEVCSTSAKSVSCSFFLARRRGAEESMPPLFLPISS